MPDTLNLILPAFLPPTAIPEYRFYSRSGRPNSGGDSVKFTFGALPDLPDAYHSGTTPDERSSFTSLISGDGSVTLVFDFVGPTSLSEDFESRGYFRLRNYFVLRGEETESSSFTWPVSDFSKNSTSGSVSYTLRIRNDISLRIALRGLDRGSGSHAFDLYMGFQ